MTYDDMEALLIELKKRVEALEKRLEQGYEVLEDPDQLPLRASRR